MNDLTRKLLTANAGGMSAIRTMIELCPVEGDGGKVAPPTHEGGKYALEKRFLEGRKDVDTVLLDSVQSQANRMEEILLNAQRAGEITIPLLQMEIPGHQILTSLSVPHRAHDAIFRDSRLDGVAFRESKIGKEMVESRAWNATGMFRICPTALLFGTWDSQGGGGVNSAKFARSLVSEIIGIDVVQGVRTASRLDPLGIKKMEGIVFESKTEQWTLDPDSAVKGKDKKPVLYKKKGTPAEINHGNIPPTIADGAFTFRTARQTSVVSFTQLRKLRFPVDGKEDSGRNAAGRALLAALGLYAITMQIKEGYQLRSRCHLVPAAPATFEWIGTVASIESAVDRESLDHALLKDTLGELYTQAKSLGLGWQETPITLTPEEKLVKLVRLSDQSVETEA